MGTNTQPQTLYVVEVEDRCISQRSGHHGCSYASPPHPADQAFALVRVLLGGSQRQLCVTDSPWQLAIAGGRRTVRLHPAGSDGQLTL